MEREQQMRKQLMQLLEGGNAHMTFEEVLEDFPLAHINTKPPKTPYSFWHFVEHIRIAQWDILAFIRNPRHVSPNYPEGYRPAPDAVASEAQWQKSIASVQADLEALKKMVHDPGVDLFAPIPHAPGYTVFREVLVAACHNSYHIGEIALMRQVLDLWPEGKKYLTGRPD
ncbi:DinB family protein [Geomesophilobacter sediminis]|uniref:DinB family protein n=1 Tax=Geomesophilobacter sediminis TaxID=2798584 RepID=A0A8J7JMU2_9BACT|nr:DinB family protein [Geomesophilobacter sediminis]MBJ6726300.1 DinB family protein [Geomesophilobacter sediminis]